MVDHIITERIAKKIANSGFCSRREAERLINNGCVKLNGNVIKNCNTNVTTKDIIEVNNQKLKEKEENLKNELINLEQTFNLKKEHLLKNIFCGV